MLIFVSHPSPPPLSPNDCDDASPNCDASATAVLHHPLPLVRAHAHESVTHPDVIAHTNATNAGNNCSFSITKSDDTIVMSHNKQCNVGQFKTMKYFEHEGKMDKHTWSVLIFDNVKGGGECGGAASSHRDYK